MIEESTKQHHAFFVVLLLCTGDSLILFACAIHGGWPD
jgi:hypothetical protein